jgi:hypothetical protein
MQAGPSAAWRANPSPYWMQQAMQSAGASQHACLEQVIGWLNMAIWQLVEAAAEICIARNCSMLNRVLKHVFSHCRHRFDRVGPR